MDYPLKFDLDGGFELVIEATNGCVHAYCYHSGSIEGDVWLFNYVTDLEVQGDVEIKPNPDTNCREPKRLQLPEEGEFRAFFNPANRRIGVYLRGTLIAVIWDGAKPGKSAFAAVSSGWAHVMENPPDLTTFQSYPS